MDVRFKTGQIIELDGTLYRVRLVANVGFEGYEAPYFYDLAAINTGITAEISYVDQNAKLIQDTTTTSSKDDFFTEWFKGFF
jgi:hypothetical protein